MFCQCHQRYATRKLRKSLREKKRCQKKFYFLVISHEIPMFTCDHLNNRKLAACVNLHYFQMNIESVECALTNIKHFIDLQPILSYAYTHTQNHTLSTIEMLNVQRLFGCHREHHMLTSSGVNSIVCCCIFKLRLFRVCSVYFQFLN